MRTAWTAAQIDFAARRYAWLRTTVAALQIDARFAAAWLAGSFGRGQTDPASDLDLHVVVAEANSALLSKPVHIQAGTVTARRTLFEQFGQLAIVHENHWNASHDGTFTYVRYQSLVKVDWHLLPASSVARPHASTLLFAHTDIPVQPMPLIGSDAEQRALLKEQRAYYWLMLDTACNYVMRKDWSRLVCQMRMVDSIATDIEHMLGERAPQPRTSLIDFDDGRRHDTDHVEAVLRSYVDRMQSLDATIESFVGETVSKDQAQSVRALLDIAAR
jgi:hypothetical protein